jgi:hypothetical protein
VSTFLNRICWDSDRRLIIVETLSAAGVYHDGLVYDVVDNSLFVNSGGTPAFYMAGIGFASDGSMLVVDASGGLPADTFWVSGLPISAAEKRLCVDAVNAVSYTHQGVVFTTVRAVAVVALGPVVPSFLLLETGDHILLESGDGLLLG